jgi:hypothetical protein
MTLVLQELGFGVMNVKTDDSQMYFTWGSSYLSHFGSFHCNPGKMPQVPDHINGEQML